ncbi:MAG: hypothetical protein ACKOKF_12450 [Bacteroidota bacterium]
MAYFTMMVFRANLVGARWNCVIVARIFMPGQLMKQWSWSNE